MLFRSPITAVHQPVVQAVIQAAATQEAAVHQAAVIPVAVHHTTAVEDHTAVAEDGNLQL